MVLPPNPPPISAGMTLIRSVLQAERRGGLGPHREVALRGGPDRGFAVLAAVGDAGVGLDVALVHGNGPELPFDDYVCCLEAGFDVAAAEFVDRGEVRWFGVAREQGAVGGVGDRGANGCGFVDGEDRGQRLVLHFDCSGGGRGLGGGDRGDRGDDVAVVERFASRHEVHCHVEFGVGGVEFGEVVAGDDGFHSRHRFGSAGVDRDDPGVGVR